MNREFGINVGQMQENKSIGPIIEACVERAERTFLSRGGQDTNPTIVQMILRGKNPIDHWYYRSNEWVDQPYLAMGIALQPYVGPSDKAPRILYGEGTFMKDDEMTEWAKLLLSDPELRRELHGNP